MSGPIRKPQKEIKLAIEAKPTETPQKKHYTTKQLNTLRIIHERVSYIDTLLAKYDSEPTAENKIELEDYFVHLRNASQLTSYVYEYIDAEHLEDTLLAKSKIRKLITEEISAKRLIKTEGLIRNPKTNPYENVPSTGNVISIVLPPEHIDELKSLLTEDFINESVRILVPCNNVILIVETGDHTGDLDTNLKYKIGRTVANFYPKYNLPFPKGFTTSEVIKYILL